MRSFGAEISGNRRPAQELSPEARSAILYGLEVGESPTELARKFNVHRSTIYDTKKRFLQHNTTKSRPRKGRPQKLNETTKRWVYRMVRRRPDISWKALTVETPGQPSISTIRRALKKYHIRKWRSKKRIPLSKEVAKKRYDFARRWLRNQAWRGWIFSDECSVQREANKRLKFVFQYQKEGFREDLVNLRYHGKPISRMVWGAIWHGGRSKLVVMERDEDSPRQGYTAKSYIKTLEEGLIEHYKPGTPFQQDNARIHTAIDTQEWFELHGIYVVEWPPHSPDLNPIEHVWNLLKRKLMELHPCLYIEGKSQSDWRYFEEAIQGSWWAIPQASIDNLIDSMPRRILAVYRARGWYTKY
jgi:transposase